jgi:hypothetical protein
MLTIGREQMERLEQAADERLVHSMARYLQQYDPGIAQSATSEGLESAARLALKRARACGFTEASFIQFYLLMMNGFGSGFDTDPQYKWLRPFLDEMPGISAWERGRLLYWHATAFIDRCYGEDEEQRAKAHERVDLVSEQTLELVGRELTSLSAEAWLAQLYPGRMQFQDSSAVESLLQRAKSYAQRYGLTSTAGAAILMLLMFVFGHEVVHDPLHPWVRGTLKDDLLAGGEKVRRLLQHLKIRMTISPSRSKNRESDG